MVEAPQTVTILSLSRIQTWSAHLIWRVHAASMSGYLCHDVAGIICQYLLFCSKVVLIHIDWISYNYSRVRGPCCLGASNYLEPWLILGPLTEY